MKNPKYNDAKQFPIKQHRFVCDNHPVLKSTAKALAKLETLVSYNESKIVEQGSVNMIQQPAKIAHRIVLSEACRASCDSLSRHLRYSSPTSKLRGHTGRDRKVVIKLSGEEKKQVVAKAKELGITDKEFVRLAFIWFSKEVKEELLTALTDSPKVPWEKLFEEWKANASPDHQSKLGKLREAHSIAYAEGHDRNRAEIDEKIAANKAWLIDNCWAKSVLRDDNGKMDWDAVTQMRLATTTEDGDDLLSIALEMTDRQEAINLLMSFELKGFTFSEEEASAVWDEHKEDALEDDEVESFFPQEVSDIKPLDMNPKYTKNLKGTQEMKRIMEDDSYLKEISARIFKERQEKEELEKSRKNESISEID